MNEELSIRKPQNESVVVYQSKDGTLSLEVQIADETVWLTQQQMSVLFNVKENNITYHIQGIYKTHELEPEATTQKIRVVRLEGNRSVARLIDYYNLDMIISVGYRVNSPNATQFRRWATGVLKEYLLRGYAVNQRIERLEQRVAKTEEQIDFFVRTSLPPVEQVFYNGEFFEARVLLERIIKTAQKRVIIIDAYVDAATFEMLDVRKKGVTATIYSGKDLTHLRDLHKESGAAPVNTCIWKNPSHDRWLIVDDSVYHCGHSLKDMGRKLSAVSLLGINAEDILKQVR
ncbi:MAG: virulence RhuM family protein [Paludibacteraceae bacterium]|nr:virulence RhuM family protein [Paludibacteraceae bacterium]